MRVGRNRQPGRGRPGRAGFDGGCDRPSRPRRPRLPAAPGRRRATLRAHARAGGAGAGAPAGRVRAPAPRDHRPAGDQRPAAVRLLGRAGALLQRRDLQLRRAAPGARGPRTRVPDERRHGGAARRLRRVGPRLRRAPGRDVGLLDPRRTARPRLPLAGPLRGQAPVLDPPRRGTALRLRDQGPAGGSRASARAERGGRAPLPAHRRRRRVRARRSSTGVFSLPAAHNAADPARRRRRAPQARALLVAAGGGLRRRRRRGGRRVPGDARRLGAGPRAQRRPGRHLPQRRARLLGDRLRRRGAPRATGEIPRYAHSGFGYLPEQASVLGAPAIWRRWRERTGPADDLRRGLAQSASARRWSRSPGSRTSRSDRPASRRSGSSSTALTGPGSR